MWVSHSPVTGTLWTGGVGREHRSVEEGRHRTGRSGLEVRICEQTVSSSGERGLPREHMQCERRD